jgi:predicted nucleic acid-binding protein
VHAACRSCSCTGGSPTVSSISNVPDDVRDELAARAGRSGRSLQEYLRGALVDDGPDGERSARVIADGSAGSGLVAPHLLPVEVAHTLRRSVQLGRIGADAASLAHRDLVRLDITLIPYETVASRVWEFRSSVRPYDASHLPVAESLDLPLATLDARLISAPGPNCEFITPP